MNGSHCPCEGCIYYTAGKTWPNPNAVDDHYCELYHKAIIYTSRYHIAAPNTWMLPHSGCYTEAEAVPTDSSIIGYSRKDGILLDR